MASSSDRIGIEFISVLGMPPPAFVALAADLECRNIGLALEPIVSCSAYSRWSLRDDPALQQQTRAALSDYGVSVSLGEGFLGLPHKDIRDAAKDMDLMAQFGAKRLNILSVDPDRARAFEQLAMFAEMAAARGMNATLEFLPGLLIGNLAMALEAVRHVGSPDFRVLIDAMHLFRSGGTVADVAGVDPATIGYIQLCDVPIVSHYGSYAEEARCERLPPGEGELPLGPFIAALSPNLIVGLEIPMLARAETGLSLRDSLAASIFATRGLLDAHCP